MDGAWQPTDFMAPLIQENIHMIHCSNMQNTGSDAANEKRLLFSLQRVKVRFDNVKVWLSDGVYVAKHGQHPVFP